MLFDLLDNSFKHSLSAFLNFSRASAELDVSTSAVKLNVLAPLISVNAEKIKQPHISIAY